MMSPLRVCGPESPLMTWDWNNQASAVDFPSVRLHGGRDLWMMDFISARRRATRAQHHHASAGYGQILRMDWHEGTFQIPTKIPHLQPQEQTCLS